MGAVILTQCDEAILSYGGGCRRQSSRVKSYCNE